MNREDEGGIVVEDADVDEVVWMKMVEMWGALLLGVDDGGGDGDMERWRDGEESPPFPPIKFSFCSLPLKFCV